MFHRSNVLCSLNCITGTSRVTEGPVLASTVPDKGYRGSFPVRTATGRAVHRPLHFVPTFRMSAATPQLPLYASMTYSGTTLILHSVWNCPVGMTTNGMN